MSHKAHQEVVIFQPGALIRAAGKVFGAKICCLERLSKADDRKIGGLDRK